MFRVFILSIIVVIFSLLGPVGGASAFGPSGSVGLGDETLHTEREVESFFPSFADSNTVGLWLFDETEYPHTTLTDASKYEYDLTLMDSGRLLAGKFGNALRISGSAFTSAYAGFKGAASAAALGEVKGHPSGLWGPAIAPEEILKALAGTDWTCEFWLKLSSTPSSEAFILDIGHAYEPGAHFNLAGSAAGFEVEDAYAGFRATCPTNAGQVTDGQWHHLAFTYDASTGQLKHYLDGRLQPAPAVSSIPVQPTPPIIYPSSLDHDSFGFTALSPFEWRRQNRFNVTVGHDRQGNRVMDGMVDELRLSNVVRYSDSFTLPGSLSRNYGANPPQPAVANGPPLLFGPDASSGPIPLGSRKHLFIDGVLVETMRDVQLKVNPPTNRQDLNFTVYDSAWRASVVDIDNKVYMYIPDSYGSSGGITRLKISEDGVNFTDPDLGVVQYGGSTHNNFVFYRSPFYGTFFKDLNPSISPEEQYKLTVWSANRGIYLYVSPDGIHWRRNETCMLPLVSGGGAETFWDDQRAVYVDFLKRDSSYNSYLCYGTARRAVMFETQEIYKTWPFEAWLYPYFEGWPFPAVTCEGPVIFAPNNNGEVYRTRAMKYPWAPDTYVAFVWRLTGDESRRVDLGVSRDGASWQFYADQAWYMEPGSADEVLSLYGLIRRGDELWHYADYGGAHGGGGSRTYARLIQRLDGFVSLDAGQRTGFVVTRPLVFEGNRLVLNIAATGWAKVGILDEAFGPVPGFDVTDCDPIKGDSVRYVVTWQNKSDVGPLAGRPLRLRFDLQNAKLYAFQFKRCYDLDGVGRLDTADLNVLASHWLEDNFAPAGQMVGWWAFDEGAGTTAQDSVGGNDGILNGDPNWVAGKVGNHALDLDGDGDYVSVSSPSIALDADTTYCMWIKISEASAANLLFDTRDPALTSDSISCWLDTVDNHLEVAGGGSVKKFAFNAGLQTWYHVAVVHNDSVDDVNAYVDGQALNAVAGCCIEPTYRNDDLTIGSRADVENEFAGQIDDLRIYNYALTAEEVMRVHQGLPLEDRFVCTGKPDADLNYDCVVNFLDFARFAVQWMDTCP